MKYFAHQLRALCPSSIAPEDFFLLLAFATRKSKEYLIAHPEHLFSEALHQKLAALLERRVQHEPVALITGHKEFCGFNFSVNRTTLVPRPETELLVEAVLENLSHQSAPLFPHPKKKLLTIIDVGTGSGNILLALLKTWEERGEIIPLSCFGLDISPEAIVLAKKNARTLRPHTRARFLVSDLLAALPAQTWRHSTHVSVLANLPYLSEKIYQACPPDVKNYEPARALMSGQEGCAHIERLLQEIATIRLGCPALPMDIWLEISPEQKKLLSKSIPLIFPQARLEFQKDLAQKYRFAHVVLRAEQM